MRQLFALALLISTASFAPVALAQNGVEPLGRSQPAAQPVVDAIPAPRDIPWPGTIVLDIDASDTTQRIWRVRQTISLASSGPLTLLYPEWLPGKHGPRGQIEKVAGLKITANGRAVGWTRDPVDV